MWKPLVFHTRFYCSVHWTIMSLIGCSCYSVQKVQSFYIGHTRVTRVEILHICEFGLMYLIYTFFFFCFSGGYDAWQGQWSRINCKFVFFVLLYLKSCFSFGLIVAIIFFCYGWKYSVFYLSNFRILHEMLKANYNRSYVNKCAYWFFDQEIIWWFFVTTTHRYLNQIWANINKNVQLERLYHLKNFNCVLNHPPYKRANECITSKSSLLTTIQQSVFKI